MSLEKPSTSGEGNSQPSRRGIVLVLVLLLLLILLREDFLVASRFDYSSALTPSMYSEGVSARPKLAVAHYVESMDQLYGVYSIHRQMMKNNMTLTYMEDGIRVDGGVSHVVITPPTMEKNHTEVLQQWLGPENIRVVDQDPLRSKLVDSGMWAQTFSKLFVWNLTEFDKILLMDTDILVRTNLMHWFEYPTPCGAQQKGDVAWNSGAMVIKPSSRIFDLMMEQLPRVKRYGVSHEPDVDPLNAGYSDQDFITAFFLNETKDDVKRRCVFPAEASILSSNFGDGRWAYYDKWRLYIYQTVHFTVHKPWRAFAEGNALVCSMLKEWYDSIDGIEKYYDLIPPVNDYSSHCG